MNRIKNAKKQTIDGILFLQGVFKTDCERVEDFFHDRLLHGTTHETKIYDKLPMVFTDLESWPKTINLFCWNCRRTIKGRPWFEPQSIDPMPKGKAGLFITPANLDRSGVKKTDYCINAKGCFCSPNCVMRHIMIFARDLADRLNKIAMLLVVYEVFTGITVKDIQPSPLITELVCYGGPLTEHQYQKIIDDANSASSKQESIEFVNNCKSFFSRLMIDD